MTNIFKLLRSDVILTLIGGIAIGTAAISIVEPISSDSGHAHVYDEARAISVEQSITSNS